MKSISAPSQYRWPVVAVVSLVTLLPLLFTRIGFGFGSASQGGAGAHFAGMTIKDYIFRFDINALAMVVVILAMTIIYNRLHQSRFVLILGLTLAVSGYIDSVHIVSTVTSQGAAVDFNAGELWASTLGRIGSACLLMVGMIILRYGHHHGNGKTALQILLPAAFILVLTRAAMFGLIESQAISISFLNNTTLATYLISGVLLQSQLRSFKLRFFGHAVLAMLIPLAASVIWVIYSVSSIFDQGFHIAVLLKWFAWMMPAVGLGIDYVNTFYARGMSSEKRFLRAVIDSIPHFIFTRDMRGNFTLVNKAVANFYGLKVHEIEGRHLTQIHDNSEQCREWIREDRETVAHGEQWDVPETTTNDNDGNQVWITAVKRPLKTGHQQIDQVLGVSIDITQQKQAELALAKRLKMETVASGILESFVHCTNDDFETRMTAILEDICQYTKATRSFIYSLDSDAKTAELIFSNKQTECPHACSSLPQNLDEESLEWILPWLNKNAPIATEHMADLPEEANTFRKVWGNKDTSAFLLLPILHHGQVFGFLGVDSCQHGNWEAGEIQFLRNVCDLFITVYSKLKSERSLVHAMEDAQASSRAKTEFLANMSHEIRTPMNCVIGLSELLRDMDPTPSQQQYLDMIHQSGNALLDLINDILDLSKIEAGQLELDPTATNLYSLVEEVAGLIAFSAQTRGLEVVCRLAPGVPENTIFDAGRLRQILTNLLNNATKFTKEGHIYINVEPVGKIDDNILLRFQITDTGIGITQGQLAKIFEKFTQADASTTRRFGGTGLGLSISQHLVSLMDGKISATSEVNAGSTFEFTIPMPPDQSSHPVMVDPTESVKVLVVTESQLSGEVLAEQVRALGHDCSVAIGCEDAMTLFPGTPEKDKPNWDYVLLDQAATKQDVPLISEKSAANPGGNGPKIVIMTAISSMLRAAELRRKGFSGSLSKPVRPSHLASLFQGNDNIFADPIDTIIEAASMQDTKPVEEASVETLPAPACPLASHPVQREQRSGPRILLAEDNPFNQKVAVGMLTLLGCTIEVANNGVEALEMIQRGPFDLVFMDCQMPEMDGYEATRKIRDLTGEVSTIPIIAMTANALSGDRRECFAVGMNDFLSKPINKAMLNDMLEKWELIKVLD